LCRFCAGQTTDSPGLCKSRQSIGCTRWPSTSIFSAKAFHNARNPSARAIGSSHPKVGSIERKVVRPARFERARGFFVAQPMWPCPRFSEHVQTNGQNGPQGLGVVARSSATMRQLDDSFIPMTRHRFDLQDLPATPWKNGGGLTREVLWQPAGASLDDFDWRVSVAQIDSDGPFSIIPTPLVQGDYELAWGTPVDVIGRQPRASLSGISRTSDMCR
jgi:hypothetical protein